MKKRIWVSIWGLAAALASSSLFAAEEPNKIQVSLLSNQQSVQPGTPFTVGILFKIEKGWHTYYKEPGDAGAAPDFRWKLPDGFKIGELQFPTPLELVEPGDIKVNGYKNEVLFWAEVTPPSKIKEKKVMLEMEGEWLVCEKLCIPESGKASLTLPVSSLPPAPANAALFERYQKMAIAPETSAPQEKRPLSKLLIFAFVGGLILNAMPCVLPVISLKVLGFVRMAQEERQRVFLLGLAFVSGILLSFAALALLVTILQGLGKEIGWGFQFQLPGFVIVMTAICFGLGLSLAGVYELTLTVPQKGLELTRREGLGGAFFQGVLATVLATPCTAPLLGVALGFAFSSSPAMMFLFFLTMGLGMSSPYLILTANPKWMRFIPKPGVWMEYFKQLMAFMLFGTCVWLLWILGRQVGVDGVVGALAFMVVLGLCAWIYGKAQFLELQKRLAWIALLLVTLWVAGDYFIAPVLNLAKPEAVREETKGEGIPWEKYDPAELEKLLADGKRVFLDFTADWCLTCKVNEKVALSQPEVAAKFAERGIIPIKLDWTRRDPEVSRLLRSFGRYGVPLYVYYPEGNRRPPQVLPEVITKGKILEVIE